jgi:hypothetical protein
MQLSIYFIGKSFFSFSILHLEKHKIALIISCSNHIKHFKTIKDNNKVTEKNPNPPV